MLRQNIVRRLRFLRNGEFFNIFFLPACLYSSLHTLKIHTWHSYAYAMFLICLILGQGVFYWHLKLQTIRNKETAFPSYFHRLFSFFKKANFGFFAMYLVLAVFRPNTAFIDFRVSIGSNALFLFAIVEYINYYEYQLSHDNWRDIRYLLTHKKLRRSPLYVDLHKTQEPSQRQTAG